VPNRSQLLFALIGRPMEIPGRVFDDPALHITVKEVLPTWDEAEREVERLNLLNANKGCIYFVSHVRYFPEGRPVSDTEA
jgi:hypothetical protein